MINKENKWIFSLVLAIIGFMVTIQFRSINAPETRDTRDVWEVRIQLQNEQERMQNLQQELADVTDFINAYEQSSEAQQIKTLNESIDELEMKAGLTDIKGSGVVIELKPNSRLVAESREFPDLTTELLSRLINELNIYGAQAIAVENERVMNLTPIREVDGTVYMNHRPLPEMPITVKVLTDNPNRLMSFMEVSQSRDEFMLSQIDFIITEEEDLVLPSYHGDIRLRSLEFNPSYEVGEE